MMTSRTDKVVRALQVVVFSLGSAVIGESQALAGDTAVPQLVGTWVGKNFTVSDKKGFVDWGTKTVQITEQKDRRFRGQFSYPAGTKHFFGVIYPDNVSFTWVAADSKGYNHGRILAPDTIAACYVESGEDATAGCAELTRQKADK